MTIPTHEEALRALDKIHTASVWEAIATLRSYIEGHTGEPVGETVEMPGSNGGFTIAVFEASKIPVGTMLYTSTPANEPVVWGKVDAVSGPNLGDQLAAIDAEPIVPVRDKPIRRVSGSKPVGVTISREDAELLLRAGQFFERSISGQKGWDMKECCARLSTAIGERG